MTDLMMTMKVGKHEKPVQFQNGIIVTNASLRQLLIYLREKYSTKEFEIKYILTNRLNQDLLENFFSL